MPPLTRFDVSFILRARVKLDIADATASISVVALGYEAEKLIGFTAYQLSQSKYEVRFSLVICACLSISQYI